MQSYLWAFVVFFIVFVKKFLFIFGTSLPWLIFLVLSFHVFQQVTSIVQNVRNLFSELHPWMGHSYRSTPQFTYHRIFDSSTIFLLANRFRLLKSICSCRFRAYYWPWNVAKIQKNRMKWLPHERLYYNFIQNNPHVLVRNNSTTAFYCGESIPFLILPFYSDQYFFSAISQTDGSRKKKKVYEQHEKEGSRCPVKFYELYLSKW